MIPDFALARGHVWHRRPEPVAHAFQYPLWLVWCNVDEPDRLLRRQKLQPQMVSPSCSVTDTLQLQSLVIMF